MSTQRSDSLRTQAAIIATAERLYSERGLEGVSLSEINRVAGQRNKSALHYHFGGREGLLKALLGKHRVKLDDERAQMLAEFGSSTELTLHDAVTLLVRPLGRRVDDHTDGGVHYIRIMAELAATPRHPLNEWLFHEPPPTFAAIAPVLYASIPDAPSLLKMRRAQLMSGIMFHALLLQTYSSPDDFGGTTEFATHNDIYINDLIDCICGLLSAAISPAAAEAIAAGSENLRHAGADGTVPPDLMPGPPGPRLD